MKLRLRFTILILSQLLVLYALCVSAKGQAPPGSASVNAYLLATAAPPGSANVNAYQAGTWNFNANSICGAPINCILGSGYTLGYDLPSNTWLTYEFQGPITAFATSTSNVSVLSGLPTIDGYTFTSGNKYLLLQGQATVTQNGLWFIPGNMGAWIRLGPFWSSGSFIVEGFQVNVLFGNTYANSIWYLSSPSIVTVDSTNAIFTEIAGSNLNTGITALTGDVTATGPGSSTATLATVNASPGTYTNATVTVNGKGLVTAASSGSGGSSVPIDYISGCYVTFDTTAVIQVSSGTVGLANGSSYTVSSTLTSGSLTLSNSTIYYVYLTSATTFTESTSAPSSNYAGTAWNDGTTSHRYIGEFLSTSTGTITNFRQVNSNTVFYKANIFGAPFQVLSGNSTVSASVSCSSVIPTTAYTALGIWFVSTVATETYFGTSDGFTPTTATGDYSVGGLVGTKQFENVELNLNSSQAFLYCNSTSSATVQIDICGYRRDR